MTSQNLAKTNVQTTLCDQRKPANASSLYLALNGCVALLSSCRDLKCENTPPSYYKVRLAPSATYLARSTHNEPSVTRSQCMSIADRYALFVSSYASRSLDVKLCVCCRTEDLWLDDCSTIVDFESIFCKRCAVGLPTSGRPAVNLLRSAQHPRRTRHRRCLGCENFSCFLFLACWLAFLVGATLAVVCFSHGSNRNLPPSGLSVSLLASC
jgi:hypothetical protein